MDLRIVLNYYLNTGKVYVKEGAPDHGRTLMYRPSENLEE